MKHVLDKFLNSARQFLLGDFSAKVDRENIFEPTTVNKVDMKLVMIMALE
jgi:hypothetical protein